MCTAKESFDRVVAEGKLGEAQLADATRQLTDCEASDWFWWFGDYNPRESVMAFDQLYRSKLANLYQLLGLTPPANLDIPISRGGVEVGGTEGAMRRAS